MANALVESFKHSVKELGLNGKQKIAIAISGGSDSTALCFLCHAAKIPVQGIIVDHAFRKDSAKEAKQVKKYIEDKFDIACTILTNKQPIPKANIEEYLRETRFRLIGEYCKKNKIKAVLTAHHLDDNIETFLMRLERGSGLDGLTGIKPANELNVTGYKLKLYRPLLKNTKVELKEILVKNKIQWVEDPSNKDTKFTRNNIRKTLEGFSDYQTILKRLSGVLDNLDRARDFIETEKNKAAKKLVKEKKGGASFSLKTYADLHNEIRLKILRELVKKYSKTKKDVRMDSIKNLDNELINGKLKALSLQGIKISRSDKGSISFE